MAIPIQLNNKNLKFCRIQKGTKRPFEKDWTNKGYSYDEISKFFPKENYGVLCGPGDLAVIDCDHEEMVDIAKKHLPKTFTVKTGSGGFHYYYFIPGMEKKIIINKDDKLKTHLGEVQSKGTQIVGPNCLHPNGNIYEIIEDIEIATLPLEELLEVLKPYMEEIKEAIEAADQERREYSEIDDLSVADIWGTAGLKQNSKGEYYGSHPQHGSVGGMNFWLNPDKNVWHCYRCDSGGGPLAAIAVKEGIINCSDAKPGRLRGDNAIDAIKIAKKTYGLVIEKQTQFKKAISAFKKTTQAEWFDQIQPIFYDNSGLWWLWESTAKKWKRVDDVDILNMVEDTTGMDTVSSKAKNEILNSLKQVGRRRIPKPIQPHWIQFRGIIVDIYTGQKIKATPEYFATNPIPWELSKENFEETPTMDKIFEEWVGKDHVKTLYQVMAYSLIPSYPINRIFCLLGIGMNGKCCPSGVVTLMADGTWKSMKDIKKGDQIISPQIDGSYTFAKIIETHSRFEPEIYDVIEENKKNKILYSCANNHDVPIIREYSQRIRDENGNCTKKRIKKRILDHYEAQHLGKINQNGSKSRIISFTPTTIGFNLPNSIIEPFCLGSWLGDGYYKKSTLSYYLSPEKKKIINQFNKSYPGELNSTRKDYRNKGITYRITIKGKFAKELTRLKLKGTTAATKFIPTECLLSSINYRKKLLSGLISTDGFIQKKTGAIYYTTKSKQLSENIKELVFSLGGYANIRYVTKGCQNNFIGKYYELSIRFDNPQTILDLPKKKMNRLKPNGKSKYKLSSVRNIGIKVKKRNKGAMVYGFELDKKQSPSQWHIVKNPKTNIPMITHNSKYLELLRRFVGNSNCCSTELDTLLMSRFEVTRLHKKLICQMGETDFNEMKKTSILKKLSGGDLIGFEYKNKDPFEENNYAKIIISTNNLPTTSDKTLGFYRRWMIIDFPNIFSEKIDILDDIPEEEYRSLALKSLTILKDLLKVRQFHKEGSIEDRQKRYEDASDPLQKFLEDFTDEDLDADITKNQFSKKYNEWARDNKHRQMSDTTIGKRMKTKHINSGRKYASWLFDGKGGQIRIWEGIKWKPGLFD